MVGRGGPPGTWLLWSGEATATVHLQHGLVALLLLFTLQHTQAADPETEHSTENVTSLPGNYTTTHNVTTILEGQTETNNTGTVVAVSIICILLCIAVFVAVYFFRRKRQFRLLDKEKKMQIQMSSARNAGVYQDLTVSVPGDEKPPASPEHERLKSAEDV
ncbi:hypothetical protein BsWGS_27444 [Bradybaena similaris]